MSLIRDAAKFLEPQAEEIVKAFYDHSFNFSEFQQKISEVGASRGGLKAAQKGYFLRLLDDR